MSSPHYAAVDLGGTNIACAIGDTTGVAARSSAPTLSHEGPHAVLSRICEMVEALGQPAALGMGVPGLVDVAAGTTKFLPNLPTQWRDVPVADILRARLGCPVSLLNDARMAALGEMRFGHGRLHRTMVFFTIGTGIGGGVVIDGQLRLGPLGAAGEIGHQTILPDGPICGCGNRGCLEALASGPAIAGEGVRLMRSGLAPGLHELTAGNAEAVTPRTMSEACDEIIRNVFERAGEFIGIAAANIVTAIYPDLVVLAGGVAEAGDLLLEPVRRTIRSRVRMFPAEDIAVVRSELGADAGLLGGLALAQEKLGKP
jgi:glucokinase